MKRSKSVRQAHDAARYGVLSGVIDFAGILTLAGVWAFAAVTVQSEVFPWVVRNYPSKETALGELPTWANALQKGILLSPLLGLAGFIAGGIWSARFTRRPF